MWVSCGHGGGLPGDGWMYRQHVIGIGLTPYPLSKGEGRGGTRSGCELTGGGRIKMKVLVLRLGFLPVSLLTGFPGWRL